MLISTIILNDIYKMNIARDYKHIKYNDEKVSILNMWYLTAIERKIRLDILNMKYK